MKTQTAIRNRGNRLILGLREDVRISMEKHAYPDHNHADAVLPLMTLQERRRRVENIVERVRRHFGRKSRKMGDRYSRVARALLNGTHWSELGVPRRSFIHARKKVEIFFESLKMRSKSTSKMVRR